MLSRKISAFFSTRKKIRKKEDVSEFVGITPKPCLCTIFVFVIVYKTTLRVWVENSNDCKVFLILSFSLE